MFPPLANPKQHNGVVFFFMPDPKLTMTVLARPNSKLLLCSGLQLAVGG
jgi:hypothetical protein